MGGKGAAGKEMGLHGLPRQKAPESTQGVLGTLWAPPGWEIAPSRQYLSRRAAVGLWGGENWLETGARDQRCPLGTHLRHPRRLTELKKDLAGPKRWR